MILSLYPSIYDGVLLEINIFQTLELINNRLNNLERNLLRMEEKFDLSLAIQRNHLIRIKNGETVTSDMILYGRPYNDLTPHEAYQIFTNKNYDFLMIDVSKKEYTPETTIRDCLRLPLENLPKEYPSISSKTTPILVMSEDGIRSILACEFLIKKGYFNINNISGGHEFWPGHKKNQIATTLNQPQPE